MNSWRIKFLFVMLSMGFGLVLFRAFQLQILPQKNVENLAKRQLYKTVEIVGRRGSILDRNGKELAVSVNSQSLFANPHEISDLREVARRLAPILDQSAAGVEAVLHKAKGRKFVWLQRQLSETQLRKLQRIDLKEIKGVGILPEYRREYPYHELAAQVLGFVSVDGHGLEGIERSFDSSLRGPVQELSLSKDALGRPLFSHTEQIQLDLSEGGSIVLTLDAGIQYAAEKALQEAILKHDASGGSAVVVDPRNGEILALANAPVFDPNQPKSFSELSKRNRAATDPFEPGSVVKPFVVAAALEKKVVNQQTKIPAGDGFLKIGNKVIGEADEKHRFKELNIVDLIRISSNVATVELQRKLGFEPMWKFFQNVGFGKATGLEVSGESRGLVVKPKPKQLLEQATMSFGQGFAVTPLQMAAAYSVLAGDGKLRGLTLVRRVGAQNRSAGPASTQIFSVKTLKQMRHILSQVVEGEGTGTAARVEGFRVAGKTGTAQKIRKDGRGYEAGSYVASFAGMLPAEDPKFVVVVSIDEPKRHGYYGGVVAAPVFSKIAQQAVRSSAELVGIKSVAVNSALGINKPEQPMKRLEQLKNGMPELSGLSLPQALKRLASAGPLIEIQGTGGRVVEQIPTPGSEVNSKTKVYLKVQ